MGQTICGGSREESRRALDLGIFDNSKHYCAVRKGSPYYRKRIKKAESRVANAKMIYADYKEEKLKRKESRECKNKRRIRSNSN